MWWLYTSHGSDVRALRESDLSIGQSEYSFIDPLIGLRGVSNSAAYAGIQDTVDAYIETRKKSGLISASVEFRDINAPGSFQINPDEMYTPASLNKIPVMMAYLALSEIHPTILRDEITYTGTTDSTSVQDIKSPVSLTPGATYTVADLIEHMIRNLDNNAVDLLMKHLKDTNNLDTYTEVYCDLGIDPKVLLTYTDNITPRQYLIFLRSLYNSTYLSRIDSEKALALMAETDFTGGISAGLPAGVKVAQKFGEVRMTDTDGNQVGKEINNCGIIYYPKHPYMLCVMTKAQGNDIAGLEETISTISRLIYTDMQKRYP